jgi:hypothetical protein
MATSVTATSSIAPIRIIGVGISGSNESGVADPAGSARGLVGAVGMGVAELTGAGVPAGIDVFTALFDTVSFSLLCSWGCPAPTEVVSP